MAKNSEVYKTAQEREKAFCEFCKMECDNCKCNKMNGGICNETPYEGTFAWLDLEAEEESFEDVVEEMRNRMIDREHSPSLWPFVDRLVAAHNRVAKMCREGKE